MDEMRSDPLVGLVLDERYRIVSRLARGGMATVYSAVDLRLDRNVALKVPHPALAADPTFLSRFIGEAKAVARLSHPNVVAVYDQGATKVQLGSSAGPAAEGSPATPASADGAVAEGVSTASDAATPASAEAHNDPTPAPSLPAGTDRTTEREIIYLVMEFVAGHTLRDEIAQHGPLPPRDAVHVAEAIAAALSAAHTAGIVHRDVKPENVLLADNGGVKVADFGLARATTAPSTQGVLLGTVAYVAPEQVQQGAGDARSDVYAAGIVLFEMLTGTPPYSGDSAMAVATRHVHEDVPAPSSVVAGLPPELDDIVRAATRRNPQERPADGSALLALLRATSGSTPAIRPSARRTSERSATAHASGTATSATTAIPVLAASGSTAHAGAGRAGPPGSVPSRPDAAHHTMALPVVPSGGPAIGGSASGAPLVPRRPIESNADNPAAPPPGSRGRLVFAGVLLAAVAVAGLVWALMYGPLAYTSTPSLIGLTEAKAKQNVENAGLKFVVGEREFSELVPAGEVLSTSPEAGASVAKNGTVTVRLSAGKERYKVPDLAGKNLREAQTALERAKLTLGEQTFDFSNTIPQGNVISTSPGEGTTVKREAAVAVVISKGVAPIVVSNVVGQPIAFAEQTLRGQGLNVETTQQTNNDVAAEVVISQEPGADTRAEPGETVRLIVSTGPELVRVPVIRNRLINRAISILNEAGFQVQTSGPRIIGRARGTNPPAGTQLPKGTLITLNTV